MPTPSRVAILKVPAAGKARFANSSVRELRRDAARESGSGAGSLWVYTPSGPDPDDGIALDAVVKLKDLSTKVVSEPYVAHEVQQLIGREPHSDVAFFTLTKGEITPLGEFDMDTLPSLGEQSGDRPLDKHSMLFSVRWRDRNVPVSKLWDGFRRALDVQVPADYPVTAPRAAARVRESSVRAAMALRVEFIDRGWPTSADVGAANGSGSTTNPAQWASDRRAAGALLGAWSSRDHTYVHPDFQFDPEGRLDPRVKDLLAALATHPDFTAEADKTGWRRVFWLYGQARDLADRDGKPRAPAEVFKSDPETVIAFARKDATVDANDVW
ncbi:MAG: hypothetical protein EPN36_14495 [Rhodanobacteraceae bacterium]|nr:MAG: hypothetical protein EPN36_14495 [Rhodanobacteraceae bacterium]